MPQFHDPEDPGVPSWPEKPQKPAEPEEELPLRTGRVHIPARQRGMDITALSHLTLHLPHGIASAAVVFVLSYPVAIMTGLPWWVPFGCWALSGVLVFSRPCERLLARRLLRLRYPAPEEELRALWQRESLFDEQGLLRVRGMIAEG